MRQQCFRIWADETFGHADLGDPRRTRRLVDMAAQVAERPGPTVTGAMSTSAAKEGAFRFLESTRVRASVVAEAMFEATSQACRDEAFVFFAVDQSSLAFMDRQNVRGLGPDDNREYSRIRGAQVMTSLAIDARGTPIGVAAQRWWLRSEAKIVRGHNDKRPLEERESCHWTRSMEEVRERLQRAAPGVTPWFVMDRGADAHHVLLDGYEGRGHLTVRTYVDRNVLRNGQERKLFACLRRQPVLDTTRVFVPKTHRRKARWVTFELRVLRRSVRVRNKNHGKEQWRDFSVVRVREVGRPPAGEKRIEWMLLTTYGVETPADAHLVVRGYTYRWRVEEFHKTWKSGACNVESSQLRSFEAIKRWATILAAVSARIERLKQLSRSQPDLDALEEFSRAELDAAIMLTETKKHQQGDELNLQQAVRLVAMVGGYMGRKADGPPGSITIRRGLERIAPAATVIEKMGTSG